MSFEKISPVILSGGAGTRLWPLSRTQMPKQMLRLLGNASLIQSAILRAPESMDFGPPVIVAGTAHHQIIVGQLAEIGVEPRCIILEPAGRNTAPAIGLAAMSLEPDALMLVMPSDQVIADMEAFHAAVAAAAPLAADGWLVTFGIAPMRPETGYGYIEASTVLTPGVRRVERFVEKPDLETAEAYVESGRFFWNAGIFLIRAETYLEALERFVPDMAAALRQAHDLGTKNGNILLPDRAAFLGIKGDSIDYAIMEKAEKVAVAPADIGWSDIGAFAALWEQLERDSAGNSVRGDAIVLNSTNCLVSSEGPLVAAIGVSDLSVVVTGDAVLVVSHGHAQDVKVVADQLKHRHSHLLEAPPIERATWGARQRLSSASGIDAYLYTIDAGAAVPLPTGAVLNATLCAGKASAGTVQLLPGIPTRLEGAVTLAGSGNGPATVIVTNSGKSDDIG